MRRAEWFPDSSSFQKRLREIRIAHPKANISASLSCHTLTFRDADTNAWLGELPRPK